MTKLPDFTNELTGEVQEVNTDELQRTEEWHADRLGMFTGSRIKDLMTCKSKAKGKDWGMHQWLFDFGDTAITYIVERAIERATGERIETAVTWQMNWGTQHEDEGKEAFEQKFDTKVKEFGFTKMAQNAGASPDGEVHHKGEDMAFEIKCPATVMSHFKLMNTPLAEGHDYFWQVQSEMFAQKMSKCAFATYDPRYPKAARIGSQVVDLSFSHILALKFRLVVAEMLLNKIIANDFIVDVRAELLVIKESCPPDHAEMDEWFNEKWEGLKL